MDVPGAQVGLVIHQAKVLSETFAAIFEAGGFVQDSDLKTILDAESRVSTGTKVLFPTQQDAIYRALLTLNTRRGATAAGPVPAARAGAGVGAGVGAGAGAASGYSWQL